VACCGRQAPLRLAAGTKQAQTARMKITDETSDDNPRLIVRLKVNLSRETLGELSRAAKEDGLSVAGKARTLIMRGLRDERQAA